MKRVLFVDEDTATEATLRHAFAPQRALWDPVFVHSGEEALAELERGPFDAIVSDLRIPRMDAPQLLAQVRERHPAVVRLCLSGATDDEAVLRAMPVTHQFLSKPCDPDTICEIIDRACSLGSILQNHTIRELIGKLDCLPTLPQTFQALSAAIASPNAHTDDISDIVSSDHALCLRTLQIVNSALFKRNAPITSIPAAVAFVGVEMLKALALSACVFNTLESSASNRLLADLQNRSLRKARFAHALLEGEHGADEAFTAALLLDVGQAVLALGAPAQFERMIALARQRKMRWHEIEAECFGAAHPEVGACLLGLWGLPLDLIETVAHHHQPSAVGHARTRLLAAVHIADAIVDATSVEAGGPPSKRLLDQLDADFVMRGDVARYLRGWKIDIEADTRTLQRLHAV